MDDRLYPQGRGGVKTRYNSAGALVIYDASGNELYRIDPNVTGGLVVPGTVRNIRRRCTIAEVNAGVTLLAALTGFKYRMITASAIAIGGAVGALDTVDILGTQSASGVKLVAFAQASLLQNAELKSGGSGAAILAGGVSYVANDVSTAITVGKTGATGTTATHVDINFTYAIEP